MAKKNILAIKRWIKSMNFELVYTHDSTDLGVKINYYTRGDFGIYEEISIVDAKSEKLRFITWSPWGIDFEVNSLQELNDAYHEYIRISPEMMPH